MRFFRSSEAVYESVRLTLDAAFGHPSPDGTVTCIQPASSAPRDDAGRIVLAVQDEFAAFPAAAEILPGLISSGAVEEIDESTYRAAVDRPV